MTDETQLLPADHAHAILEEAITEHLGDDWHDDENGWSVVTRESHRVHLAKGSEAVEFSVNVAPDGAYMVDKTRSSFLTELRWIAIWLCIVIGQGLVLLTIRVLGYL